MYDENSLSLLLSKAGFAQAVAKSWGESSIPNILSVEPQSRASETLYMEAALELPAQC
jgi:hypothetical protein